MKINYKNTALNFLDHPDKIDFYLPDDSKGRSKEELRRFALSLRDTFPSVAPYFKDNIRLISRPFYEAYLKGKSKLANLWDKEEISESGTFIFPGASRTNTWFYMIKTGGTKQKWECSVILLLFTKIHKSDLPGLDVMISESGDTVKHFMWKGFADQGIDITRYLADVIGLLTFLKYCEVETKIINASKRDHHAGEKYVNETKQNIQILDSTWFTNIIRSQGFSVGAETGGFFRLQPCGPRLSEQKLIWILPFEKEGYIRKAKVLNNQ